MPGRRQGVEPGVCAAGDGARLLLAGRRGEVQPGAGAADGDGEPGRRGARGGARRGDAVARRRLRVQPAGRQRVGALGGAGPRAPARAAAAVRWSGLSSAAVCARCCGAQSGGLCFRYSRSESRRLEQHAEGRVWCSRTSTRRLSPCIVACAARVRRAGCGCQQAASLSSWTVQSLAASSKRCRRRHARAVPQPSRQVLVPI